MKKYLLITAFLLAFGFIANAQITRAMASRYNNVSVKGNIVFVANNIVTTPLGTTTEMPPAGTSSNNGNPCTHIDIDTDVPAHTAKIPFGSVWNYHSNNAAPPNDGSARRWINPAYTLTGPWNINAIPVNGPGKYGYSNPANATISTCIKSMGSPTSCVPAAGTKYSAYYFRKTVNFTAAEPAAFSTVLINMKRIDGIVVYINGVERIRDNMPAGVINYGTFARNDLGFAQENTVFYADPSMFNAGVNTIAVEVHTAAAGATNMAFDMQMLGIDAASTFNSSSATLNLNSCSQVLFAGLYWGANHQQNTNSDTSWIKQETKIKFKIPGSSSYQIVTSSQTDYHNGIRSPLPTPLVHAGYASFADVTSLVNTLNPNGVYTVGDVTAPIGWNSGGAGWTLVIAYANPLEIQRNLTVFDGSAIVKLGQPALLVPISGFLTPPSGPVSCELGVVVYDGDRGTHSGAPPTLLLDSFLFKQNSNPAIGTYTNLTPNATSTLNNMFNSTISTKGVLNPGRTPSHNNTLGFDADIIEVPNAGNAVLGNGQTSASIKLASPQEDIMVQVLTTAISIYNPSYAFEKTAVDLNGGTFLPGDSLLYKIKYSNFGNDSSVNTIITDNLPIGAAFVPGSIKIGTTTRTDGMGDDQAEYDFANNRIRFRLGVGANAVNGGRVGPSVIDSVEFKVVAASSCAIVSCVGSLRNSARINYGGKLSGNILFDSTGVNVAGCISQGPVIHPLSGPCFVPKDTLIVNRCNSFSVLLPYAKYAGYTFYSAQPFIPANIYNQYIPVTTSGVYWAYFTNGAGCSDTARIVVIITSCPDIDDDNDGIPDYVEFDKSLALAGSPTPNWNNPAYPGYVDNNLDLVNDNFDWGADADNDGIPNFYDTGFWIAFVDSNGDGVNDAADKDKDGIPNQYDLDSDNDGIPDVVESFGVDVNGNGIIDNYADGDNDGFSTNVDGSTGGVNGSGIGLGPLNLDNDTIPNYLDLDSDNDGIPDVVEVAGADVTNSGLLDAFVDANFDGIHDSYINIGGLLRTGPDAIAPFNGKAESYPFKNFDSDSRPNPYDIDSDGDGIVDVIETGFNNPSLLGWVVGPYGTDGWSDVIDAQASLNNQNTDGRGNPNYLDIDSDDDGIPDQIEGQTTANPLPAGYMMPLGTDADGDGLDTRWDNRPLLFGGTGIVPVNIDGDPLPDYIDLDTDSDGQPDIVEGNDFNMNGIADDDVALTFLDSDGDGLDNKFDSSNTSIEGTSYNLANGGYTTGDPTPGARCPVQRKVATNVDRDWRFIGTVLPAKSLIFNGALNGANTLLNWQIITQHEIDRFEIERSINNSAFIKVASVVKIVLLNTPQGFTFSDDITMIATGTIYYRLKVVTKSGEIIYSNVISVQKKSSYSSVMIVPNPVKDYAHIHFEAITEGLISFKLLDNTGRLILKEDKKVVKGHNMILLNNFSKVSNGIYILQFLLNDIMVVEKLVINNK
ncbi:MAG: T9SS type A sorting domain-containing protein [Chitinophagaceae bacterium]|nr:T9SS type A sorting domain-containing protein [Chitinophagaceae bacterium]